MVSKTMVKESRQAIYKRTAQRRGTLAQPRLASKRKH